MIFLITIFTAFASDIGNKETISELKSIKEQSVDWKKGANETKNTKRPITNQTIDFSNIGSDLHKEATNQSLVIRPRSDLKSSSIPLVVGDIFDCRISEDIIGYTGSLSPVRAEILEGPFKGYFFVGNATMDPKTKNVLIQFHKIRSHDGQKLANTVATLHDSSGALGVEGTYNSYYWRYFFASMLSAAARGYAEATVQRQRDFFGQFQNTPSQGSAVKVGAAEGFSQTADMMAENMKTAPEYVRVSGPIRTKIFIIDNELLNRRKDGT